MRTLRRSAVQAGERVHAPTRSPSDDTIPYDRRDTGISSACVLHTIICVNSRPPPCCSGRAPSRWLGQRCRSNRRRRSAEQRGRECRRVHKYDDENVTIVAIHIISCEKSIAYDFERISVSYLHLFPAACKSRLITKLSVPARGSDERNYAS